MLLLLISAAIILCSLYLLMPFCAFHLSMLSLSHIVLIAQLFLCEDVQQFRAEVLFYCSEKLPFSRQFQIYWLASLQLLHSFISKLVPSFTREVWERQLDLALDKLLFSLPFYLDLASTIDMPSFTGYAAALHFGCAR